MGTTQKIKVGIDARPLSYGYTGNSRYLAESLIYLSQDTRFSFYLYSNKPIHPVFDFLQKDFHLEFMPIRKSPGVIWLNWHLPSLLKKDKMDVFWGTLQLLPFFKLPIPSVVNYHDLNFRSAPQTMTKSNYLQHKVMSRFTLQNADRIFCLSQNTYNEICEYRPKSKQKLKVIYPGANRPKFEPENLPYKDFLFTVGTLEPRKNISTLLNSYLQLKKENPNYPYPLLIAGRIGWGDSTLAKGLQAKTYEPQGVFFIENPSDAGLLYLYRNCKFFVFPSLHEGFGLPLIEAIVENKPCIGSDIPVFREILREPTDLFVSPLDTHGWKEAIQKMSERKDFKRNPPCSELDWNWKKTASEIAEEISNLWINTKKESKTHAI